MGLIILVSALVFLTAGCQEPTTPNNSETDDDGDDDNDYINEIIAALENSKDGTEKENPVVLNLDMDMGKMSSGESNWQKLLAGIGAIDKFVTLDLSACTLEEHPNPYFHPDYTVSTGKDKIVRLILPDAASDITGGSGASDYAFKHFSALEYVKGKNITHLGSWAFYDCRKLKEIDFPAVTAINQGVFYGCVSLINVDMPDVVLIGNNAFFNCTSLKEVVFLKAMIIEPFSFGNCTSLTTARFLADPVRTSDDHPRKDWLKWYEEDKTIGTPKRMVSEDSMYIHNDTFNGCVSLITLDIRNVWNVFFAVSSLANISSHLDIYLYDDIGIPDENNKRSYGHPQTEWFLGGELVGSTRTIESIKLILPSVEGDSQIIKPISPGRHGMFVQLGDANQYGPHVSTTIERRNDLYN